MKPEKTAPSAICREDTPMSPSQSFLYHSCNSLLFAWKGRKLMPYLFWANDTWWCANKAQLLMEAQANKGYFIFTDLTSLFMAVRPQHSCLKLPALLFLLALNFFLCNYHNFSGNRNTPARNLVQPPHGVLASPFSKKLNWVSVRAANWGLKMHCFWNSACLFINMYN